MESPAVFLTGIAVQASFIIPENLDVYKVTTANPRSVRRVERRRVVERYPVWIEMDRIRINRNRGKLVATQIFNRDHDPVDDFIKGNVSISMVIESQPDESSLVSGQILHASRHRGGPVLNLPLEGSPHPIAFGADAHVDLQRRPALSAQYYRRTRRDHNCDDCHRLPVPLHKECKVQNAVAVSINQSALATPVPILSFEQAAEILHVQPCHL
jgi:hypothetical protein